MATFGERLKELRSEKGLTLDELKDYLNTTKATLSRYENDKREPKIDFANKAATYFDVTLDYMLGVSDEKEGTNNSSNIKSKVDLSREIALKLVDELLKDGYEIKEEDIPNLLLASKIALKSNKK